MQWGLWRQLPSSWATGGCPSPLRGAQAVISMQPWLNMHAAIPTSLLQLDHRLLSSHAGSSCTACCYATTSAAGPNKRDSPGKPTDWTTHSHTKFSIRPSLLSPLFFTYQSELKRSSRAQVVNQLLDAHSLLATEVDGIDNTQVERTAQHRASSLLQLSRDLRALATRTNLPACTDKRLMLGFYSLLDKQLDAGQAASSANTTRQGAAAGQLLAGAQQSSNMAAGAGDAQVYHDVATGKVSAWDAWLTHFALRYAATPSLPPLDIIYAQAHSQQAPALADTSTTTTAAATEAKAAQLGGLQEKIGARVDVTGTALAEGKRKTSVARIKLRKGSGSITVNGQPYDAYFTQLSHRLHMLQPLLLTAGTNTWDVQAEVSGAGKSSQAQAIRTAIARGMLLFKQDVPAVVRWPLTRMARWDGRMVERKKPGKRKARASHAYVRR